MADVFGVNATKRDNSEPTSKIDVTEEKGRLRCLYDSYTFSGDGGFTAGDKIFLMEIPKGAKVYDAEIKTSGALDTTAADIEVGWAASSETGAEAADPNGLILASDTVAALGARMAYTAAGKFKTFSESVRVEVDLTVAPDSEDGETLELTVYYTLD